MGSGVDTTVGPGYFARRSGWLAEIALLFVVPALFLYSGLFQRYPLPGWVDPGIYLGYQLDLPSLVQRYGFGATTYHGARLSWVLPGYWIHNIFPAAIAREVIVGLMFFVSTGSAWLAGRGWGGRLGGQLAAASIAYNPLFLSAIAFGAIDGATLTYLLAAAAFLFAPHEGELSLNRLFGFGVMVSLATIAHPGAVPMAGAMALAYVLKGQVPLRKLLRQAMEVAAGGVLAFASVAAIAVLYGYPLWFPGVSAAMAQRSMSGFGSKYRVPVTDWLFSSYRLLIPVLLLFALVVALRQAVPGRRRVFLAALLMLGASAAPFVGFDYIIGGSTLQTRAYTNLLLPACALAIAALATWRPTDQQLPLQGQLLLAAPAVLAAGIYALDPDWLADPSLQLAVFLALLAAGVATALWARRSTGTLVALSAVLLACAALNQDSANVYVPRTGVNFRDGYLGAQQLQQAIDNDEGLRRRRLLFWYKRDGFDTGNPEANKLLAFPLRYEDRDFRYTYYDTLASLYLWDVSLFSADFPATDAGFVKLLDTDAPAHAVVLVSQHAGDLQRARDKLEREGLGTHLRNTVAFESPTFGYTAWIMDLCVLDRVPGTPAACHQTPAIKQELANELGKNTLQPTVHDRPRARVHRGSKRRTQARR